MQNRFHSYLNSARHILAAYDGGEPFSSFLRKYFAAQKKHGSKDRRLISQLCYSFFRIGLLKNDLPPEERFAIGIFLCSKSPNELLAFLNPGWNEIAGLPLPEKLRAAGVHQAGGIFPFSADLSEDVEKTEFTLSHLYQPDVFIRARPGMETLVNQKLEAASIDFSRLTNSCFALPNSVNIEQVINLNKEAVVQDYSSQRVGELLVEAPFADENGLRVWDCCAASGGKAIMAWDILRETELTLTDIRESILANLRRRLKEAGIDHYRSYVKDLSQPAASISGSPFDLIIADVPCSGSGTWGRSPEQLSYFRQDRVDEYASLQRAIVGNVAVHAKPGGYILYVTCSVFRKENEEVVEYISEKLGFELIRKEVLKGYHLKADTMFAALLRRPS